MAPILSGLVAFTRAAIAATRQLIDAVQPSVVLFPHTLETREWVPRLAAMLDTGLVMDCTALNAEGSDLVVSKPVYGGGVIAQYVVRGATRLVTVRTGVFESVAGAASGAINKIAVAEPAAGRVILIDEQKSQAEGGVRLKDATTIVSGGRGLGGPDNWHYIEEAAAAIGGAVGCSRPVADSGWVSSAHQVGTGGNGFGGPDESTTSEATTSTQPAAIWSRRQRHTRRKSCQQVSSAFGGAETVAGPQNLSAVNKRWTPRM